MVTHSSILHEPGKLYGQRSPGLVHGVARVRQLSNYTTTKCLRVTGIQGMEGGQSPPHGCFQHRVLLDPSQSQGLPALAAILQAGPQCLWALSPSSFSLTNSWRSDQGDLDSFTTLNSMPYAYLSVDHDV